MPRVMRIINRLNLGGPTYNAGYLTRYLSPEFETMLVAGMKDATEESSEFILDDLGLKPVYIPNMHRSINPLKDHAAYKTIKKLMRDFKPDIVHTHASKSGTLGRLAAISLNVPVILHTFHGHVFHSYFNPLKSRMFIQIERYLARHSNAIIAISELQKHELSTVHKICNADKIEIIPLGFDLNRFQVGQEELRSGFRQKYNIPDQAVAIGILGRLVRVKNHTLFLKALAETMASSSQPVVGVVIGNGECLSELRAQTLALGMKWNNRYEDGVPNQVIFTSWIKKAELAIAGLDIVALSSMNEGTPVSLIEAQAASKPVVSTRVGGIGNVVSEGLSGLLSDSNNVSQMATNLLRLAQDGSLRLKMGAAGCEFVSERFHFNRLVSETTALYHRLLAAQSLN